MITRPEKTELIQLFINRFPDLYLAMKNTEQGVSAKQPTPYHVEGDVWTHTMMVVSYAETYLGTIAALLHDIGKPFTKKIMHFEDAEIAKFSGHESLGFFMLPEVLSEFELSNEEEKRIKLAIALYGSFRKVNREQFIKQTIGFDDETLAVLVELLTADSNGRYCFDDGVWQYDAETVLFDGYRDSLQEVHQHKLDQLNKTITLLIGLPGAGKSSYIQKKLKDKEIVSRDDFIDRLGVGQDYNDKFAYLEKNKKAKKELDKSFDNHFARVVKDASEVVIDMTNLTKNNRSTFVSQGMRGFKIEAKVFATGVQECEKNNLNRIGKSLDKATLVRMAKRFQFPLFDEVDEIELV